MPHVIVKLWPGKSEQRKNRLGRCNHKRCDDCPQRRGVRVRGDGRGQISLYKPISKTNGTASTRSRATTPLE